MLGYIKYKRYFKVISLIVIVVLFLYMFFFRGWVRTTEKKEQELNRVFSRIDSLDYPQSFSKLHTQIEINSEIYTVIYGEESKSYNVYIFSPGKQSLSFSICNKYDFQLKDSKLNKIYYSEDEFKKEIKAKYGSIDILYNLFWNDISTDKGKAYLSPVSRVRSEIYSFTGEKNISGIFSTQKYVVGFNCTSSNGSLDFLLAFLDNLSEQK